MARAQSATEPKVSSVDPIWEDVQAEAEIAIEREPSLGGFIYATVLSQERLDDAILLVMWRKFDSFEEGSNFRAWAARSNVS